MEQIEVGSVFSGLGGIEYGFEQAGGFKTIWNCETDPYASAILKKHWSSVPNLGNIKEVDWTSIRRPDLICGGFPCQDISNAGKRAGITGERSGLWKEYAKAIGILRPRYVFIENVSALTGRGLNVVLADLASCGYDAEWDCIPAQAVGAPHRRDRLFIVAYSKRNGTNEGDRNENNRRKEKSKYSDKLISTSERERVRRKVQERPIFEGSRKELNEFASRHRQDVPDTNSRRLAENKICTGRQVLNERGNISNTNSKRLEISENPRIFENSRKELQEFAVRYSQGRGYWAVEPAICRVAHGIPNRVHRIKCLGNSVVPQVAQFIAERIKKREEILR